MSAMRSLPAMTVGLLAVTFATVTASAQTRATPGATRAPTSASSGGLVATLRSATLDIEPIGVSIDVPTEWLDWQSEFHDAFSLSPTALVAERNGAGEWDTEYAAAANAVLPYESCVARAGGEAFGGEAVGFGDLQMRIYVVEDTPNSVLARAARDGRAALARASHHDADLVRDDVTPWRAVTISSELHYGDYGGTAHVQFRAREFAGRTLVLVFMYAWEHERDVAAILGSTRVGSTAPPNSGVVNANRPPRRRH